MTWRDRAGQGLTTTSRAVRSLQVGVARAGLPHPAATRPSPVRLRPGLAPLRQPHWPSRSPLNSQPSKARSCSAARYRSRRRFSRSWAEESTVEVLPRGLVIVASGRVPGRCEELLAYYGPDSRAWVVPSVSLKHNATRLGPDDRPLTVRQRFRNMPAARRGRRLGLEERSV